MPSYTQERKLSFVPRRDKQNDRDPLAPKPVHPRALENHGFFGVTFVRQHLMVDERWSPNSLAEQFGGMTDLLERRAIFKRHETKDNRQRYFRESKRLKLQCRLGRTKLQNVMVGNNNHSVRNFLIGHRDMQRLYQRMPIDLVVDNINQRTFVMRKERDRLQCRLSQLKHQYREMLINRAILENRIKYQNEFVLEEEIKSQIFMKRIENSNVRMKAIKAINTTYQKIIQVLVQDAIFYEPILRSLDEDMEDQANFIKHILYLGMPAIAKFKELNNQHQQLELRSRKNLWEKQQIFASIQNPKQGRSLKNTTRAKTEELPASADPKRYLRETRSMMVLKNVQKVVEKTIKEVKFGTLSAQAREIYPRMKSKMDNNQKMNRICAHECMTRESLEVKLNVATVLQDVLINNLSDEEISRLERMKDLRKELQQANKFEQDTAQYIQNRADVFVMFRVVLWNLIDILGQVESNPKKFSYEYKSSYLKLPLLKFEMLNMCSVPPEFYLTDVDKIMNVLKRKVYKVMKVYNADMESSLQSYKAKYHSDFVEANNKCESSEEDDPQGAAVDAVILQDQKTLADVPNRKQIKAQSSRIVEDAVRRLEE